MNLDQFNDMDEVWVDIESHPDIMESEFDEYLDEANEG